MMGLSLMVSGPIPMMLPCINWQKSRNQILIWRWKLKFFETNGPSLYRCVKSAWRSGGWKYFRHNLSCELRRGRYKDCYGYKDTFWDNVLFSLGVFLMDPLGRYHKRIHQQHKLTFCLDAPITMTDCQWLRHPIWWVRRRAAKCIEIRLNHQKNG